MRFLVTSGFGSHRASPDNSFHVSREGPDRECGVTEVPPSMWMDTSKGGNSADALGIAQIHVQQKVVVM
jgi:hypothetical protein